MDWKVTQTVQDAGRDAIESHAEREAGDAVEEVEVGGWDAVRDADVEPRTLAAECRRRCPPGPCRPVHRSP